MVKEVSPLQSENASSPISDTLSGMMIAVSPLQVVEQQNQFSGDYAVSVRSGFEIAGKRAEILERLFGRRFPGTEVEAVETSQLNDLGEPVSASPAISQGQLFIRTHEALYCIGK